MSIFRYQNFCFLAIAALMVSMLFCGFNQTLAFVVLSGTVTLAAIAGVAVCSKPTLQLRCAIINVTLLLAYQIWVVVAMIRMKEQFIFTLAAFYPLISLIIDLFAIKFALKDISQDAAYDLYHNLRKARMIKPQKIKK